MKKLRLVAVSNQALVEAATVVSNGGIVAYPTDTVYGLGCMPFNGRAVERVVRIKSRLKAGLPVLVDSLQTAKMLANFDPLSERLAGRFWPGPLTIVVPARVAFPREVVSDGAVGLRIPARTETHDLISRCGGSILGTSANLSGHPSAQTAKEVADQLGSQVDLILDGGPSRSQFESSVVKVVGGKLTVLREAAIERSELESTVTVEKG